MYVSVNYKSHIPFPPFPAFFKYSTNVQGVGWVGLDLMEPSMLFKIIILLFYSQNRDEI